MVLTPRRLARTANAFAFRSPNLRAENDRRLIEYGRGLQLACQYTRRGWPRRRITTRRTPMIPDLPLRRSNSAHHRRVIGRYFFSRTRKYFCAARKARRLPPHDWSAKKALWVMPLRCRRTKKPWVRLSCWSMREMPRIRLDLPRFMSLSISLFPQFGHRKIDGRRVRELASFANDAKFCAS